MKEKNKITKLNQILLKMNKNNNNDEKKIKNIDLWYIVLFLTSGIGLLIIGQFIFGAGLHNTDLSHNLMILEEKNNINLIDMGSDYMYRNLDYYYVLGNNQIIIGFFVFGLGFFLTGYYLVLLMIKSCGGKFDK